MTIGEHTTIHSADESVARRDSTVRVLLRTGELAWMLDEEYQTIGPTWQFDLVRQGVQGRWMMQRYRYDIPSGTLHFTGEYAIDDETFVVARQRGKQIDTRHT